MIRKLFTGILLAAAVPCFAQSVIVENGGKVGIGTSAPASKLDVRGGLTLEAGRDASIYTGTGSTELNRYLGLYNSSSRGSASGLKAGGILVSDSYAYANPGKSDLVVKGNVGIGVANPLLKLDVQGGGISISGENPISSVNSFNNTLQLRNPDHSAIVYNPGETTELMFGFHSNGRFYWGSKSDNYGMFLDKTGVLTVTNSAIIGGQRIPGYQLSVNGKIAAKEVNVTLNGWADYVFSSGYKLRPVPELKQFIQQHGHLPGIPTATEVESSGVNLGEMNRKLLEKIEELTLYVIEKDEQLARQARLLEKQKREIEDFKSEIRAKLRSLEHNP